MHNNTQIADSIRKAVDNLNALIEQAAQKKLRVSVVQRLSDEAIAATPNPSDRDKITVRITLTEEY